MAADGTAEGSATYPTVYGFWTNKGGVGKTTLTFHMATTYAELFPDKVVVAIDMCPQSNLSATLLTNTQEKYREPGDKVVEMMQETEKAGNQISKTIGGYFTTKVNGSAKDLSITADKYLINVSSKNSQIPKNLWLVCGDTDLDLLAPNLSTLAAFAANTMGNPFKNVHNYLRDFIEQLNEYFAKQNKELVVFIDTNPALSIHTQIALCAMTQLVIPVSADTFSLQAVSNMYNQVYGLYPTKGRAKDFEKDTFAYKVKEFNMDLPKITAIIHNKNPILRDNGQEPAIHPAAYTLMADEQVERVFDGYDKAKRENQLDRVFRPVSAAAGTGSISTQDKFAKEYVSAIRDMRSAGVAAAHSGFPIWKLDEKFQWIGKEFKSTGFKESVPGLIKDMLIAMKVVLGNDYPPDDSLELKRLQKLANKGADTTDGSGTKKTGSKNRAK